VSPSPGIWKSSDRMLVGDCGSSDLVDEDGYITLSILMMCLVESQRRKGLSFFFGWREGVSFV